MQISEKGMCLFRNHALSNCYDPLYVIVDYFNETSKLQIILITGRKHAKHEHRK